MPEVSVIVPNYNHAPFLKQRIDSIINQTYQDIEIIILDDKSADNSIDIIETYRNHPKVAHIVRNEQNSGSTFKQWERGISLAKGNWVWIAESDDWCEPTLLETLSPAFEQSRSCSIAFCQSIAFRNTGEIIMNTSNHLMEEFIDGRRFISERMLYRNSIFNASMAIFKKEYYYHVTDRFTRFKFCGDWLFWIEIARNGNVFISGKMLNYFRKHEKDVSSKAFTSGVYYDEYIKLAENLFELNFISGAERKSMIKDNFKKYYFEKAADKSTRKRLATNYRSALGISYYLMSPGLLYKKCKIRLHLISLAVKRRVNALASS